MPHAAIECRYLLGAVMLACLTLGGGTASGQAIDAVLQILVIAAATYTIVRLWHRPASSPGWMLFALVAGAGLAQVIPLPTRLVRELRPDAFLPHLAELGMANTHSTISLTTSRTIASLAASLSSIYLFIAFSKLSTDEIHSLLPFLFAGVIANLSALTLNSAGVGGHFGYASGAGLFANDNHLATLFCSGIPLVVYYGFRSRRIYLSAFLTALLLAALVAIGSRAGILIGAAVVAISAFLLVWRTPIGNLVAFGLLALATVYAYGRFLGLEGNDPGPTPDRGDFLRTTLRGIGDNWLLGTGYGSFDLVYPHYERLEDVYAAYVNHAHNDYLEIMLEGGVIGALIVALCLGWLLTRFVACGSNAPQRLSFLSICVVLVHSGVDYPLRTTAMAAAFAFFNALYFCADRGAAAADAAPRGGRGTGSAADHSVFRQGVDFHQLADMAPQRPGRDAVGPGDRVGRIAR